MRIVHRLSTSGATDSQISGLERLIGRTLPSDYRHFLAEVNGGRPSPCDFEGPNGDGSLVNWFFTLNQEKPLDFIPNVITVLNDRIPPGLLPIADDPFGNIVLLDVGAKSVGSIYFWEHENENFDGDAWWDNISYIAPSFTDFVNGLH